MARESSYDRLDESHLEAWNDDVIHWRKHIATSLQSFLGSPQEHLRWQMIAVGFFLARGVRIAHLRKYIAELDKRRWWP